MKKVLFIVNPIAGKMKILKDLLEIDKAFYNGDCSCDIYFTKKKGDATEKVIESGANYDLIVCGGGDGTYNELITGVLTSGIKVPVGYIPAGTTNDFASTLELSQNPVTAAANITCGKIKKLDVGKFADSYFSYIASFGAFTSTSYSTQQQMKNVFGHSAYLLEGMTELSSIKPYHVRLEVDGKIYEDDYLFGAISNSTSIAGLIKLDTKLVNLSDGQFEIMLIRMPKLLIDVPKVIIALANGDYNEEHITFLHASKVKVKTSGTLDWALDGEYASSTDEIVLENVHEAIDFVI
ncbi:MAG: YegS/Rv2252/BmrU family lipid kinase [Ruminococcaceae bacterium]|nr:YegS/Rv2252/BmrU family lipid kinase [Oscillospiraceae bacterium]